MRFSREKVEKTKTHPIKTRSAPVVSSPASPSRDVLYRRAVGNQYLASLHEQQAEQMPLQLQAKPLYIGTPGDRYEQEAERVAKQVMRMPEPQVQRRCACGGIAGPDGECAKCRAKRLGLQRTSTASNPIVEAPPSVYQTLSQPGRPLDATTRAFMELRFRQDFSGVRLHDDPQAAQSASEVNALAYTVGNHIVFGARQYSLHTKASRHLLAHELTHVMQQDSGHLASTLQRAMICSKRLDNPLGLLGINHAYIDDTGRNDCLGSGMSGNFAIQTLVSGNFIAGCAAKTDVSTDPQSYTPNAKPCEPKAGVTDVSQCLRDAFNRYANPSVYRNPRGPNSNTFAYTLANACCADSSDSGLGIVPGWGRNPAPPCPTESERFEPRYLGGGAYLGEDGIIRQGAGPKL